MTKTFFLGLGGQKCGSSWMQAYLARQQGSDFGRLGEYQIWESDLGGVFERYRVPDPGALAKLRARAKRAVGAPEPVPHLRWRLQSDRNSYFDYFDALLAKPGIERTGDVTPSYAALPAETLGLIAYSMASRDIETKVLFCMRDPVARLASQVNMDMAKGYQPHRALPDALSAFFDSDEAMARSRYDQTLAAIDAVFAPEKTHITLFETLFSERGISALSKFSGVPSDPSAGAAQINARGSDAIVLPDELTRKIARHYAPVYQAVIDRIPEAEHLWPSARFL